MSETRRHRGAQSHHAGRCAEDAVARHYRASGRPIAAERWRCPWGEIDLIARDGDEVIFIEVKQSRSHAEAALHLSAQQMGRIVNAASVFLGGEPLGQATPVRFDLAMVDGAGRIEVLEGAFA
jgi:putative endonuclease